MYRNELAVLEWHNLCMGKWCEHGKATETPGTWRCVNSIHYASVDILHLASSYVSVHVCVLVSLPINRALCVPRHSRHQLAPLTPPHQHFIKFCYELLRTWCEFVMTEGEQETLRGLLIAHLGVLKSKMIISIVPRDYEVNWHSSLWLDYLQMQEQYEGKHGPFYFPFPCTWTGNSHSKALLTIFTVKIM